MTGHHAAHNYIYEDNQKMLQKYLVHIKKRINFDYIYKKSDMNKEYKGKVHGLRIIRTSAFGHRNWEVRFATGKAYFEYSMKNQFPFALGDTIRFEGEWLEAINGRYFQITKVIDVNDCILWDMHEQQRMAAFVLEN